MAPRRGGGGSSSGSSVSSCPGAFSSRLEQVNFVNDVLFLAVMLGIFIATFIIRKKTSGVGKKLLGLPFIGAVLFLLIGYILSVIGTVLLQCRTTDYNSVYNFNIAVGVFINLSYWLLLVVVVYVLNVMLRQQLGQVSAILKIALLIVIGVMGALTAAKIGMQSYLSWTQTQDEYYYGSYGPGLSYSTVRQFAAAWNSLYLISVLAAGALALFTIMSLRSTRSAAGDLIGWIVALFISMTFWVVLLIVFIAWTLERADVDWETQTALSYLLNFGQALSFIFIFCIAKHASWNMPMVADPIGHQDTYAGVIPPHQYGKTAYSNGQAYQYQQVPPTTYHGGPNPIEA